MTEREAAVGPAAELSAGSFPPKRCLELRDCHGTPFSFPKPGCRAGRGPSLSGLGARPHSAGSLEAVKRKSRQPCSAQPAARGDQAEGPAPSTRCPAGPRNALRAAVGVLLAVRGGGAPWESHRPLIKASKLLPQLFSGFSMLECSRWSEQC